MSRRTLASEQVVTDDGLFAAGADAADAVEDRGTVPAFRAVAVASAVVIHCHT